MGDPFTTNELLEALPDSDALEADEVESTAAIGGS